MAFLLEFITGKAFPYIIIAALCAALFWVHTSKKSQAADYELKLAASTTEKANLSNKLSEKTRELEISKVNEDRAKADSVAVRAWADRYVEGCATGKQLCDKRLEDCINATPPVDVNVSGGPKGVSHEKGKRSLNRIGDMFGDGLQSKAPGPGPGTGN